MRYLILAVFLAIVAGASAIHWGLGVFAYLFTGFCIWSLSPQDAVLWRMCVAWAPALVWYRVRDFTCGEGKR